MKLLQALLYLAAAVLLFVAAFNPRRASLVCSAAAVALCAYSLPTIDEAL